MNEVLSVIASRRSVRSYQSESIPENILTAILEAGQAAPYSEPNSRHFTVIQNKEILSRINVSAKKAGKTLGNKTLVHLCANSDFDGTYGAPVIIILSGNEHAKQYEAVCAASAQNMLIAAQSLGISSCWAYFPIFAFHSAANGNWHEELCIPVGYHPYISILLGYGAPAKPGNTTDHYKNSITYI